MFYKGTKTQCTSYNNLVIKGEEYDGSNTKDWCLPIECIGYWAVIAHPDYTSTMDSVDSIQTLASLQQ